MVPLPYRSIILLVLLLSCAYAGTVPQDGRCSSDNDHQDPATHRLLTECMDKAFCSAPVNGTCVSKQCARDEYPFGYTQGEIVPPLCPRGTFCPDEGSGCKALVAIGQSCQLDRDEQCAPPPNWSYLASGLNFNGSLCLKGKCRYANITLGQACQIENTTYLDLDLTGEPIKTTVIRDNCRTPELFCDTATMLCEHTKVTGGTCQTDGECKTHNCGENGYCIDQPETPLNVAPWQYVILVLCIVAGGFGDRKFTLKFDHPIVATITTCIALNFVHKRDHKQRRREVQDYYNEQTRSVFYC
ncbi:hypothetical protein PILCRDRAFT_73344 [Piloderma croceum F 1598]|uniref:Dickkopf N-terminal cysteine-rich domain-containing protein n=1 Tax=Piloderma croceum (strain F 1598) TaxID=765440 RepID=A0A0C3B2E4_PILCF|nr:hypothetical protein PILCRDRAFT_73344 [Piloderma croceum F 1598]